MGVYTFIYSGTLFINEFSCTTESLISVFTIHKATIMIIHVDMIYGICNHDNILFLISLLDQFNEVSKPSYCCV
jgi:hypothetical protein